MIEDQENPDALDHEALDLRGYSKNAINKLINLAADLFLGYRQNPIHDPDEEGYQEELDTHLAQAALEAHAFINLANNLMQSYKHQNPDQYDGPSGILKPPPPSARETGSLNPQAAWPFVGDRKP